MTSQTVLETGKNKPYLSMSIIAKYRSNLTNTEKGKAARRISIIRAFEREDGIVFNCSQGYRTSVSETPDYSDLFHYKLAIRKNKKGEKRFIFYKVNRAGNTSRVRTSNPNQMRDRMFSASLQSYGKNKRVTGLLPKTQIKRLLKVVHTFLDKHGIPYKGLSKDPFSLMYQLCYPASAAFDSETLQKLQCSKFLLRDPVKDTLRTKGKLSRRPIYATVKNQPRAINTALTLARYIRINRSLDHAQQFLKLFSEDKIYFYDDCSPHDNFSLTKLKARQLKVLDRLSVEELIEVAKEHNFLQDTFSMLEQLGGNEGFNFNEIQYRSLRELHDQLARLTPRRRYGLESQFTHYDFDVKSAPMMFCEHLKGKLGSKYEVSYAGNTKQLQEHAEKFHNCSFFYHPRIASGGYGIFCIDGKYMFGVQFNKERVTLDQAVTFCNQKIELDLYTEMNTEIKKALASSYNYTFRESNSLW